MWAISKYKQEHCLKRTCHVLFVQKLELTVIKWFISLNGNAEECDVFMLKRHILKKVVSPFLFASASCLLSGGFPKKMYTCFDKEPHISHETHNLLYFTHEINTSSGVEEGALKSCVFSRKSRHPSTKAGRADPRWEDRERRSSGGTHAQTGRRQTAGVAALAGNPAHEAAGGEPVKQSLKQIFWWVVNEIIETGPYWAIMWVTQRVSNFHV